MIALLLAAQLATPAQPVAGSPALVQRPARACGLWNAEPVRRDAPQGRFQSLGELPPANHELAVLRLDRDGCSLPVIVRRNVQGDGRFPAPRR